VCHYTDGSDDQDVLLALQELQREHVLELTTIELNRSRPIKVVQGDALLETGLEQVALQGLLLAPLDLVGQQQGQELGVIQLLALASVSRSGRVGTSWPSFKRLSKRTRSASTLMARSRE
jgi:hypothetical protein